MWLLLHLSRTTRIFWHSRTHLRLWKALRSKAPSEKTRQPPQSADPASPPCLHTRPLARSRCCEWLSLGQPMPHSKFIGPAFRLVRTLESVLDQGHRRVPVRLELFQNPENPRQFRYRAWVLEWFKLQAQYHAEPLPHEA